MTIQERIEKLKNQKNPYWNYVFSKIELTELLQQVAKEQREICADNVFWESGKETDQYYMRESIIDAPSPLDKEEA